MNWIELNARLSSLSEDEVKSLLAQEREGARRKVFLERLHQRYAALRSARERAEIMAEAQLDR